MVIVVVQFLFFSCNVPSGLIRVIRSMPNISCVDWRTCRNVMLLGQGMCDVMNQDHRIKTCFAPARPFVHIKHSELPFYHKMFYGSLNYSIMKI